MSSCPHCPDGHDDPRTKPWSVCVSPDLDGDGQPTTLMVGPSNCSHVAESDAEWLRSVLRKARAEPESMTELEQLREGIAELEDVIRSERAIHEQWIRRTEQAEAAVARVRALHQPEQPPEWRQWVSGGREPKCQGCSDGNPFTAPDWPCPTIRALDGEDTDRG